MERHDLKQRALELEDAIHTLQALKKSKLALPEDKHLSQAELNFIMLLNRLDKEGPVMPSRIAEKQGISMSAITHHINSLEKLGYVVRTASHEDRRVVYLNLNSKGKELVSELKKHHNKQLYSLVEHLGEKNSTELIRLIGKVSDFIKEV